MPLEHIDWLNVVGKVGAWFVTALCAAVSIRSAVVFAKHNYNIYSILVLFSLIWAILIPYYSEPSPSELLQGFAGFILVHIGTLLRREKGLGGGFIDHAAQWLFLFLVFPSLVTVVILITVGKVLPDWWSFTPFVATLITLLGYFFVFNAMRGYSTSLKWKRALGVILLVYSVTEGAFTFFWYYLRFHGYKCPDPPEGSSYFLVPPCAPMNIWFLFFFMALKISFCTTFICLVLRERLSFDDRCFSTLKRLARLLPGNLELGDEEVPCLQKALSSNDPNDHLHALHHLKRLVERGSIVAQKALDSNSKGQSSTASS